MVSVIIITTREADGTTFGRVGQSVCLSVCLCVCPVRALTFESLDLETSFLVRRYTFRISRPSSYVKVIGSRSRSYEPKNWIYERSRVVRLRLEGKLVFYRR